MVTNHGGSAHGQFASGTTSAAENPIRFTALQYQLIFNPAPRPRAGANIHSHEQLQRQWKAGPI